MQDFRTEHEAASTSDAKALDSRGPRRRGWIFAERSLTKVAALYPSRGAAENAARRARAASGLQSGQVRILPPDDLAGDGVDRLGRAVEPETAGIARTLVRSHVTLGIGGAVVGVLLWGLLRLINSDVVLYTTVWSLVPFVMIGAAAGMLLAGALSLRPDHAALITRLRRGLREGRWAVVAHPRSSGEARAAGRAMSTAGGKAMSTL